MKRGLPISAPVDKYPLEQFLCISGDVLLGRNVKLSKFINLYGCTIGDDTKIGAFVEIQKNAVVGKNCKISSHTFVCEGVIVEDDVFIGHGVVFTNDIYPRATMSGKLQTEADWVVEPTLVKKGASVGSGATILPRITIGEHAIVGAGSVVTTDVPARAIVAGNPARVLRYLNRDGSVPAKPVRDHGRGPVMALRQNRLTKVRGDIQLRPLSAPNGALVDTKTKDVSP